MIGRFRGRGIFVWGYPAQAFYSLRVNMNFGVGLEGEPLELLDDTSLGAVAAIEKRGNYRNAH